MHISLYIATALQIKAVGYTKVVAVSCKIVPFVHIHTSSFVSHNLCPYLAAYCITFCLHTHLIEETFGFRSFFEIPALLLPEKTIACNN